VVDGVVAQRLPGVDVSPVTDCVINVASASEILGLASASVTGVTAQTAQTAIEIATRREALTCIGENSTRLLGVAI